jgi:hypothetical protein
MEKNAFTIDNYNIFMSTFEEFIYIKVIDNFSLKSYENNLSIIKLKLLLDNKNIYSILKKCFNNNDDNYKVIFYKKDNFIKVDFNVIFDNFFYISFNLIFKEICTDLENKINYLENKITNLENIVESLVNMSSYTSNIDPFHEKINNYELYIHCSNNKFDLNKIEYFYQLNKLELTNYIMDKIMFKNKTLKILVFNKNLGLKTFENLGQYLPLLENIEFNIDTINYDNDIKLSSDNFIFYLKDIKNIKKISFVGGCGSLTKHKLIPYCLKNNIEIIYS